MAVKPVPEGYHTVTPYLMVRSAEPIIAFLVAAFDGRETERIPSASGGISHAEVQVGDSVIMIGEVSEPAATMPAMLYLYLPDADTAYARALRAGASSTQEPRDEPYGDRTAAVRDAAGNQWYLATHIEDMSAAEMARRATSAHA